MNLLAADVSPLAAHLWAAVIAVSLVMYAILDGFDIGTGILLGFERDARCRGAMLRAISTVWDGNETWLILIGVALFGGFPLAFGAVLSSFYLPVIFLIVALIARGVVFEFHAESRRPRVWEWQIALASLVIAFLHGAILGALWTGVAAVDEAAAFGGLRALLSPPAMLGGATVVVLDLVLGCAWLRIKLPDGTFRADTALPRRLTATLLVLLAVVAALAVAIAAPLDGAGPARLTLWLGGGAVAMALALGLLRSWRGSDPAAPFRLAVLTLGVLVTTAALVQYPDLLPGALTLVEAASPENAQWFLLIGVGLAMPVIAAYTLYAYRVFRGEVAMAPGGAKASVVNPRPAPRTPPDPAPPARPAFAAAPPRATALAWGAVVVFPLVFLVVTSAFGTGIGLVGVGLLWLTVGLVALRGGGRQE